MDLEGKENSVNNYAKGIQLDKNHVTHNTSKIPICLETEALHNVYPMYNKIFAYPKPGHEYSPEEYYAYKWYKKMGKENNTTKRLDCVWANDISIGVRLYPNFVHKNLPQEEFKVERFLEDDGIKENRLKFAIKINEIYPENCNEEYQFEEILANRIERGERKLKFVPNSTILIEEEMDETKLITNVYGRKSMFPSRKSILPPRQTNVYHQAEPQIERDTAANLKVAVQNNATDKELQIRPTAPSESFQLVTSANKNTLSINVSEPSDSRVQRQLQEIAALKKSVQPAESSQISDLEKSKVFEQPRNPHPNELSYPTIQQPKNDQIIKTNPPTLTKPTLFEIYEDETSENAVGIDRKKASNPPHVDFEQDFVFKTPAPTVVSKKKPFQIYEEEEKQEEEDGEEVEERSTNSNNDVFAAYETCSTQTFNFFIRSQFASTPKQVLKSQSYIMPRNEIETNAPEKTQTVAAQFEIDDSIIIPTLPQMKDTFIDRSPDFLGFDDDDDGKETKSFQKEELSPWASSTVTINHATSTANNINSCQIHEKSLHIKEEIEDSEFWRPSIDNVAPKKSIPAIFSATPKRHSIDFNSEITPLPAQASTSIIDHPKKSSFPRSTDNSKKLSNLSGRSLSNMVKLVKHDDEVFEDGQKSIYYAKTPNCESKSWSDENDDDADGGNGGDIILHQGNFHNREIDFEQTRLIIEEYLKCPTLNPFESKLRNAFLDQFDFYDHLKEVPTCTVVNSIPALKKNDAVQLGDNSFNVLKIVGEGGFGTIFCAKERNTKKLYAIKQQTPPNLWEYYICLQLRSRLTNKDIASYFMNVEYATIGQNSSLLFSSFSKYGCLITVCIKVEQYTGRNMDEYIAMMLTSQMLNILDNLHALNIIHADIKPNNFLLISKLKYGSNLPVLQLIDFGTAIDLALFSEGQTFTHCPEIVNDFTCVEMRENRPWTFQTDLFGLAASIHVLLFGKYMDVEKRLSGWVHKSKLPRYFNKSTWDVIFNSLLNVRDCKSMPNLLYLRTLLEEEITLKEKYLRDKINQFNYAIEATIK